MLKNHNSQELVIQLELFTLGILKVWLAGKNQQLPGDWFELWNNFWSRPCFRQLRVCACVLDTAVFLYSLMERTGALKMIMFALWNLDLY